MQPGDIMCYASVIHSGYGESRMLDLSLFSCSLSCIQASVDNVSRWLALILSLQPALSLFRWLTSQLSSILLCFSIDFVFAVSTEPAPVLNLEYQQHTTLWGPITHTQVGFSLYLENGCSDKALNPTVSLKSLPKPYIYP